MKFLSYLLFFVLIISLNKPKNNSVKITYQVILKNSEFDNKKYKKEVNEFLTEALRQKQEMIQEIEFSLIANSKQYYFYYTKPMTLDDNNNYFSVSGAVSRAIDGDYIYGNTEEKTSILGGFDVGVKIDRKINMSDLEWTLIKETKTILGMVCYKAIGKLKKSEAANKAQYPITAWYCPKINYQCGPTPFATIPGAILELENTKTKITAKKIKIGNYQFKIPKAKKKTLTYSEYIAYMTEWSDRNFPKKQE